MYLLYFFRKKLLWKYQCVTNNEFISVIWYENLNLLVFLKLFLTTAYFKGVKRSLFPADIGIQDSPKHLFSGWYLNNF